ncbi:MAG: DUF29 domain-containing protein [Mesorhizobium sp.]|nr:DUF29 domain-containing protein [Mesorhizobium sp.]
MGEVVQKPADDSLYERDFFAWLNDQAAKLRARSHNDLDWDNLAEEVESVGISQKREIRRRLELLVHHLLKWQFQPGRRSESWRITIGEQRTFIPGIIEDSPSLARFPAEAYEKAYSAGRKAAINETGLLPETFPVKPPFTVEEALNETFLPGEPFAPWDVIRD